MHNHLRYFLIPILSIKILLRHVNGQDFESIYNYVSDSCYEDGNNYIDNLKPGAMYCDVIFNGACWPQTRAGFTVVRPCPYLFFNDTEFITRRCNETGVWGSMNFSMCKRLTEQETKEVILGIAREMNMSGIHLTSIDLYMGQNQAFVTCSWISFVFSVVSLMVLLIIKDEENDRFKLHKNLVFSFFMRILLFFVDHYAGLSNISGFKNLCNAFWVFNRYFAVAEVTWMLNEAVVLLRRVTNAIDTRLHYNRLLMWGWGFPAFLTFLIYVPVMVSVPSSHQRCWSYHGQSLQMLVLYAPMTAMLVINFGIMLFIIRILIRKMRDENFSEARIVWKTAKGALFLMPSMGFIYLIMIYTPVDDSRFNIYASVFYPLQGIVVCLFYVIFNREVQKQLFHQWREWSAVKCLRQKSRQNIQLEFDHVKELEQPAVCLLPSRECNSFLDSNARLVLPSMDIHIGGRIKNQQELRSTVSVMSQDSYLTSVRGQAFLGGTCSKHSNSKDGMVYVADRNCYSEELLSQALGYFV